MDEFDLIETPENVELRRRLAGIGSRFMAGLIDALIILLLDAALALVLLGVLWATVFDYTDLAGALGTWLYAALILVFFVIYWGYYVLAEMLTNGQSPGKRAMKIRVVKQDGGPITFLDVAIRNLLRVVDGMPGVAYAVAGLVMFFTKRTQRLGDLAAGTVVVAEEVPDYAATTDRKVAARWEREASPEALRATGLAPREYRVLLNYWARRHQFPLETSRRLLRQILQPILQRTGRAIADDDVEGLLDYADALIQKAEVAERGRGPADPGAGPLGGDAP
jgi:uncharacterized RDD family membrane protein YckC